MAHDIVSPGVSVLVADQTSYAAVTQGTVAATVGFAEKGPLDEPTLITSRDEFLSTFGKPIEDNCYMGMFADKFLSLSTSYFTRIAKAQDYESVTATSTPTLASIKSGNNKFWVDISGFPVPNDGIYQVTLATSAPATLAALIADINTKMATVTLNDGSTKLSDYLTADDDTGGTKLVFKSDNYRNVVITLRTDSTADALVLMGFVDEASSTDVGAYAYSYIRVPVNQVAATNASITATAAMTQDDLDKLDAFYLVNLKVDGTTGAPFKTYADLNIKPSTGTAGTFPQLLAALVPSYPLSWAGLTFTATLAGFYSFAAGGVPNVTGDVNKTHTVTVSTTAANIADLVTNLNTGLAACTVGTGHNLKEYIQFEASSTYLNLKQGTDTTLKNFGANVSVTIADGTGTIATLGYSTSTNDSADGTASTYTVAGVAAKITAGVTEATGSASTSILSIESNRDGATSFIEILTPTTTAKNALSIIHFTTGTNDTGSGETSTNGVINFVAKTAGTWGDLIDVRTYSSVNPVTSATQYYIEVYYDDVSVETWGPVDWTDSTATTYVKTVLEDSDYIMVDFSETLEYPSTDTGTVPLAACPDSGGSNPDYWVLAGGNNGIPSSSTDADALAVTALSDYENKEEYEFDVLLAPGFVGSSVTAKLQTVANNRGDVVALIDPPSNLTYVEVINWHNGDYSSSTVLSSSHAVATWDWQRDYDDANAQYVDLPPSIYMAVALANTQKNYELWEAPAGPDRGVVSSISSYSKPTAAQRELLNNDTDPSCINPIVQFPTEGIMIYGQKTCLRTTKSLNRINVRRLINHIKRNVEKIGRKYIFRLNEASTWASISRELNSFLGNIQERGGLQAYTVIFDDTTTTSARIDAGIMYGKIFVQPTKVAERIFIDITIQNTGALVGE